MAKANTPKRLPATFVSLKDVMLDLLKTQLETDRTVFDEKIGMHYLARIAAR